jgi:hypothetical protein
VGRLEELNDLKEILWAAIRDTDSGRDIAALANRLTDVLQQIEVAEKASAPVKGTPLDELRAKRSRRGAGAGVRARPASG